MELDGIGTKTEGMTVGVGAPAILIRRYGTAMLLMVLFLIGSFVMQHVATREKVDDAAQINIAGRQRMLSQRILYLSHLPKDALDANRAELTQLLTQFNNAFVAQSSDPNLSPVLRDAYFASTSAVVGQSLADMVREFYASGRNFVEGRQPEAALLTLERLGSQQMLTKLEAVVTTYQIEARARAVLIDRLASISLIGALLTLLFEGVVIFWPTVAANPTQMAILFNCLLQNAGKFRSVSRGLVLDIWADHGAPGEMTLCLGDNGIGVAAASREAVFGMFKRLHVRSDYPGDGIGLAICARVAQAHQGGIVMRDGLTGQGVVVAVTLMRPEAAELGFAAPETDLVIACHADARAA